MTTKNPLEEALQLQYAVVDIIQDSHKYVNCTVRFGR